MNFPITTDVGLSFIIKGKAKLKNRLIHKKLTSTAMMSSSVSACESGVIEGDSLQGTQSLNCKNSLKSCYFIFILPLMPHVSTVLHLKRNCGFLDDQLSNHKLASGGKVLG